MAEERILIQVEPRAPGEALTPQSADGKLRELTAAQIDAIGRQITTISKAITDRLKKDELTPKEFSIEFGIGIEVEGGVPFVAKGTVETNFKITATWDWK
jgi:hypothetical protein